LNKFEGKLTMIWW